MGVYIKGMEMPTSCAECLDIGWHYVFECHLDDMEDGERMPTCPLVPVPPHGRLGDLDALRKDWLENHRYALTRSILDRYALTRSILDSLDNAPTIIPAEEET